MSGRDLCGRLEIPQVSRGTATVRKTARKNIKRTLSSCRADHEPRTQMHTGFEDVGTRENNTKFEERGDTLYLSAWVIGTQWVSWETMGWW